MRASLRKICVGAGLAAALMTVAAGCGPTPEPVRGATRPVPTAPGVPIGLPAGQQIGAGGGSLSSTDGLVRIELPAGAVQAGTEISIQEITNLAPSGVGSAYRLAPHGTAFPTPVTLTFRTDLASAGVDDLTVAYQDESGYWSRVPGVSRDAAAGTLTVTTLHLSDWSLVTGPTPRDLAGTFTVTSTIGVPFTVDGTVTLTFAGENAEESFYLLGGTHAPRAPIALGGTACTPDVPTQALVTNLAELFKTPPELWWGVSGYWNLTCSDASRVAIEYAFDTLGLSKVSCARGWVGVPTLGPERVVGSYAIDCGVQGTMTGTLSFQSASCGQPCTSANPCHTAAYDCGSGTAVCTDTGNVANGTTCGTDLVCNAGTCVACAANQTCTTQPDTLCHAGVTDCSTGTSVCVNGAALPDGTSCGTDMVCSAGTCVACAASQACTTQPDPLCHAGVTNCSTGTSVCENGAALPDGTSCGTDLVCSAGACVACAADQACTTQPDQECHLGVTSCATGSSVCVNGAALPDGTGCGVDMVCSGGACAACVANQTCTTQPDTLCHAGVTDCSTGTSVCVNGAALPDGTSCGTDMVCSAGTCVACAASQACTTQPDTLCHAGVTDCATGTSVCVNGAALPDGTSCGTDLVCSAGTCVACAAGQICTTQPDPLCHAGVTSCSTGTSLCVNGAALSNGTPCGSVVGDTCNAGVCGPSRTVLGTRLVTHWPDGGAPLAPVPAPDTYAPPLATVAALVPRADGGFETYAGAIDASGNISIPDVPVGAYILSFVDGAGTHTFLETAADTVDLGYDVLGRPDAALPLASTPITLDVSGLAPWTAGDEIQLVSSNADVFDVPSRTATVADGATAISLVDDWFSSALGGPMHLLAPSDVLWVHDLATLSVTPIGGSTPYPYLSAANAASVTGLTFTSGVPVTVNVALTPAPGTGDVTGSPTTGIDWRLTQFEAQLPALTGLAAMPAGSIHALSVGAAAGPLANPAPIATGSPTLFRIELAAGTGDFATAAGLAYGQFLPAGWSEWRGVELSVPVALTLPPATSPVADRASLGQREAMSPAPPTPIVPALLPVQAPAVNGSAAFGALSGVGTTPVLSWSAPPAPSAAPTSYTVEIVALDVSGSSTIATPVASWRVGGTRTEVTVPAGLLEPGRTYYARIGARASAPEPLLTKPLSGEHAAAWATTLTGTFTP